MKYNESDKFCLIYLFSVPLICLLAFGCQVPNLSNNCDPNGKPFSDQVLSRLILNSSNANDKLFLKAAFPDKVFECESGVQNSATVASSGAATDTSSTQSSSTDTTTSAGETATSSSSITSVSYPSSLGFQVQNKSISSIVPTIVGGTPTSCSASPSLPTGLAIDQTNCTISGTPTVGTVPTTYTITATNTSSSVSTTISFKVHFEPKYVFFGHFFSNDIARFSFSPTTGVLTNLGANSGLGGARKGRDLASDPLGKFLFSATFDGNDVGSQAIQSNGSLGTRSLVTQINNSESITVDPTGKFAYSVGTSGSFAAAYSINQSTGALTFANSVTTGLTCRHVRVHPNGKFVYIMDRTSGFEQIMVFSINQTTGALTASSTYTLGTPGTPEQVAIHPNGKFLYSSDRTGFKIRKFDLNPDTGALSNELTYSGITLGPEHLIISPSEKYLFVAGQSSTTVRRYTIDSATGNLTFGADFTVSNNVSDMAIDPSENFIIVSDFNADLYQVLRIDSTNGTLTSVVSVTASGGDGPNTIAIVGFN